jgi:hypothetical protein
LPFRNANRHVPGPPTNGIRPTALPLSRGLHRSPDGTRRRDSCRSLAGAEALLLGGVNGGAAGAAPAAAGFPGHVRRASSASARCRFHRRPRRAPEAGGFAAHGHRRVPTPSPRGRRRRACLGL